MRTRLICILVLMLWGGLPLAAQPGNDCGSGLPCGSVPWRLPALPDLSSPTPMPTINATPPDVNANPGPGTPTATPYNTPTPVGDGISVDSLEDTMVTLQAVMFATPIEIINPDTDSGDMGENAGNLFGYILGLQGVHFGALTPLVSFAFFTLFFVILTKFTFLILPILVVILGLIRKLVSTILEFIPL